MSRISKKLEGFLQRSSSTKPHKVVFAERAESCSTGVELIKRQLENELVTSLADVTSSIRQAAPAIAANAEELSSCGKAIETARLRAIESKEVLQGALVSGKPALDEMNKMATELAFMLTQKLGKHSGNKQQL